MNKLGYKQKGIPMLKSPLNVEDGLIMRGIKGAGSAQSAQSVQNRRREAGNFTKDEARRANAPKTPPGPMVDQPSLESNNKPAKFKSILGEGFNKSSTGGGSTRSRNLTTANAGIKTQKINVLDSGAARTSQIPTPGKAERKDILDSKASKTTASRIGKSRKDIRKEKRANIKGGMSRQEARLKKTQSKAASAKAKTNRTIKSIDPTKAKSADTGAKQTSARATRAKAKRLEKRAERLKGRVNASKVSK